MTTAIAAAAILGAILLIAYMLKLVNDHTEKELEQHITTALDIANRWCRCADPHEVTMDHGRTHCTPKEHQ